jgi:hypothetical protein
LRIFDQHCDTHTPQGLFSGDQLEAILFQSLLPYETMYDVAPDGTAFVGGAERIFQSDDAHINHNS